MYNLNFIRLISWLLPDVQPNMLAYVNALITPVKVLYADFMAARQQDLYRMNHNSQVCYLRAALNDGFDPVERRITISNGYRYTRRYWYTKAEERPIYMYTTDEEMPFYMHQRNDYADNSVDFIVNVPKALEGVVSEITLNARTDFYKLATKRHKIYYYE